MEPAKNLNKNGSGGNYWRCRCVCGMTRTINTHRLIRGKTSKCLRCSARQINEIEDLSGITFGKWTALKRIPVDERKGRDLSWLCRCQCGTERPMAIPALKRGGGCKRCQIKHGPQLRPYEHVYNTARARVLNRYDRRTHEFTITFEEFLALVNTGRCHYCHAILAWQKHGGAGATRHCAHHMDRKDNHGGYTMQNVVACCTRCNFAKGDRYTYEEWVGMTQYFRNRS